MGNLPKVEHLLHTMLRVVGPLKGEGRFRGGGAKKNSILKFEKFLFGTPPFIILFDDKRMRDLEYRSICSFLLAEITSHFLIHCQGLEENELVTVEVPLYKYFKNKGGGGVQGRGGKQNSILKFEKFLFGPPPPFIILFDGKRMRDLEYRSICSFFLAEITSHFLIHCQGLEENELDR